MIQGLRGRSAVGVEDAERLIAGLADFDAVFSELKAEGSNSATASAGLRWRPGVQHASQPSECGPVRNPRIGQLIGGPDIGRQPGINPASEYRIADGAGNECQIADRAGNEYRFVDEVGNEYRYTVDESGGAVVTACDAVSECVQVPARIGGRTVCAIGANAFSSAGAGIQLNVRMRTRNAGLMRVVLPEGVRSIGRAAFRGCLRLAEVVLPDTLREIDDYAFSCTALREISLPASCTRLAPRALRLGPESLIQAESPYRSKLERVNVPADNPYLTMRGPLLCRNVGAGAVEALLCPSRADTVDLTRDIACIADGAFAGTQRIGQLRVRAGLRLSAENGLVADAACGRIVVQLTSGEARGSQHRDPSSSKGEKPYASAGAGGSAGGSAGARGAGQIDSGEHIDLVMPQGAAGVRILGCTKGMDSFDAARFVAEYDRALPDMQDRLQQAKLMAARLARPILLDEAPRALFERILRAELDALCVHFGARNYWEGFDCLLAAGILDEGALSHAVDVLTARADSCAVSYLLGLKRAHYPEAGWDYDL